MSKFLNSSKIYGVALLLTSFFGSDPFAYSQVLSDPLGATIHSGSVTFRVWAPFVKSVAVSIVGGGEFAMEQEPGHTDPSDTVWTVSVPKIGTGSKYRYVMTNTDGTTSSFNDPRTRLLTAPDQSAFSVITSSINPAKPFQTPNFNQMVIYELHIGTFTGGPGTGLEEGTFASAVGKLDYLKELGINAVEILPVHENFVGTGHTPATYDWGYDPVQYFAVKSDYGGPDGLTAFINEAHSRGMAVVIDVVYNHMVPQNLLEKFGGFSLPNLNDGVYFYGPNLVDTGFGPRPDYGRPQVQQYIIDSSLMWLRDFNADGLRWDSVINIRAEGNSSSAPNENGASLVEMANNDYRNTSPKQPQKISIAEDLQSSSVIVRPTASSGGLGFNSQWEESIYFALSQAVAAPLDSSRNMSSVAQAIRNKVGSDSFNRVIYSENHDKVGHPSDNQIRIPSLIDQGDPQSLFAKKRSSLAAGIVLTSPGIPMLFQGQEMLETRPFDFFTAPFMDWARTSSMSGMIQMYHDLISLRRNMSGTTAGLTGQNVNVFHINDKDKLLGYHRYENGGQGDDVVVLANFSNQSFSSYNIGFPRGGSWKVRFNSGSQVYDPGFTNGNSFDLVANSGPKDGLSFNGNVGIGPYSLIILSQ